MRCAQLATTLSLARDVCLRRSDFDDSVGYWFVQPTGQEKCRVYYSCDTKLRGWVPGPVYNLLGKTALKQTTTWVNEEALKEWRKLSRRNGADRLLAGLRRLKMPTPTQPKLPKMPRLPELRLKQLKQDAASLTLSARRALGGRRTSLPAAPPTVV